MSAARQKYISKSKAVRLSVVSIDKWVSLIRRARDALDIDSKKGYMTSAKNKSVLEGLALHEGILM